MNPTFALSQRGALLVAKRFHDEIGAQLTRGRLISQSIRGFQDRQSLTLEKLLRGAA